jgi:hypothetical protein
MFMMYGRPTNPNDECIYPEPDTQTVKTTPNPTLTNLKKEIVLDKISEICEARCEYNYELIEFFSSTTISDAEKAERFSSIYPGTQPKNYTLFIEASKNDLEFFHTAQKQILKYRNKNCPDDFPIFFELSEFFNLYLVERKSEKKQKKTYVLTDENSEESTIRYCIKKLNSHVESEIKVVFEDLFELRCNLMETGYYFKSNTGHNADIDMGSYSSALDKYLKHMRTITVPLPSDPSFIPQYTYLELYCSNVKELINNLTNLTAAIEMTEGFKENKNYTGVKAGVILRKHFYKIYYLNKKITEKIGLLETMITQKDDLMQIKNASLLSSKTPSQEATETTPAQESAKTIPAEEAVKEKPTQKTTEAQPQDEDDETIEQDIFAAYAEFRELKTKKLKQKQHNPGVHEEKKELSETDLEQTQIVAKLENCNLQQAHMDTLQQIFDTPVPHYQIKWKDLEKLILKCGGLIDNDTGSSRKTIRLPSFYVHTLIDNEVINQRGPHSKHQSGHNIKTVSRWVINIFRKALERAGITTDVIEQLNRAPRFHNFT